jgi:thiaminase (transcriptional activator TenA)
MSAPATSDALRRSALAVWERILDHGFPRGLADGTLPPDRFRSYVSQNLLYLPEYARMIAVGASRSADSAALAEWTRALVNIVEVEIPQNERMRADVVELAGPVPVIEDIPAPATVAYTSWLLANAATGDAPDISAALLPCAWSYGEIARALVGGAVEHPVYSGWLRFFASDEYAAVVADLRAAMDRDLAAADERKRERLADIFLTGCRMELLFWDQGLSGAHWPDLQD